jgi:hypothetical protein
LPARLFVVVGAVVVEGILAEGVLAGVLVPRVVALTAATNVAQLGID